MNGQRKIFLFLCIIMLLVFLTACDFIYHPDPLDEEIYLYGFAFTNVDDETPNVYSFEEGDYGVHNFSYNFPAYAPETYLSYLMLKPERLLTSIPDTVQVAAPLNQVIHVFGISSEFTGDYSFQRGVFLNPVYHENKSIQLALQSSNLELPASDWKEGQINIIPGEYKEYTYGGPYTPASIGFKEGSNILDLRKHLLNGKNTFVLKEIYNKTSGLDKPFVELYKDDILIDSGNLTEKDLFLEEVISESWSNNLSHAIENNFSSFEAAKYKLILTVPTYYNVFNITETIVEFNYPQEDSNPPWIDNLQTSPKFEYNKSYEISFDVFDDEDNLEEVSVWYSLDRVNWEEVDIQQGGSLISGNFEVDSGEEISLKIFVSDTSENNQTYYIYPVALLKNKLFLELRQDSAIFVPGKTINFMGTIKDENGQAINNLIVDIFVDDEEVGKTYSTYDEVYNRQTRYYDKINLGQFTFSFEVPDNFNYSNSNISFEFGGTGVYPIKRHNMSKISMIGNESDIITNLENVSLEISNMELEDYNEGVYIVQIMENGSPRVEFEFNFSEDALNFSLLNITKQENGSGSIVVRGFDLLSQNFTKTVYVDNIVGNRVCVVDDNVTEISQISSTCDGQGEIPLFCNGQSYLGYTCSLIDSRYKVEGLNHSAVLEFEDTTNPKVTGITLSDSSITKSKAGTQLILTINYDKKMNTTTKPEITFDPDIVDSGTLTFNEISNWEDKFTYLAIYDISDVGEKRNRVDIEIKAAKDLVGNTQVSKTYSNKIKVDMTSSTTTTTTGGGGVSITGSQIMHQVQTFPNMEAGKSYSMSITNPLIPIRLMTIYPSENVTNAILTVYTMASRPRGVPILPGSVYKYVEIINTQISKIDKVTFRFSIPLNWLNENGVDKDKMALYRYSDARWNQLETNYVSDDGVTAYYEAESPGLSYFGIATKTSGTPAPPVQEAPSIEPETEVSEDDSEPGPEKSKSSINTQTLIYLIILVLILISVGVSAYFGYHWYHERKKEAYLENEKPFENIKLKIRKIVNKIKPKQKVVSKKSQELTSINKTGEEVEESWRTLVNEYLEKQNPSSKEEAKDGDFMIRKF